VLSPATGAFGLATGVGCAFFQMSVSLDLVIFLDLSVNSAVKPYGLVSLKFFNNPFFYKTFYKNR